MNSLGQTHFACVLDFAWRTTGGLEGNQRMGRKVHWIRLSFYIHAVKSSYIHA
jgi:hypothetical protein